MQYRPPAGLIPQAYGQRPQYNAGPAHQYGVPRPQGPGYQDVSRPAYPAGPERVPQGGPGPSAQAYLAPQQYGGSNLATLSYGGPSQAPQPYGVPNQVVRPYGAPNQAPTQYGTQPEYPQYGVSAQQYGGPPGSFQQGAAAASHAPYQSGGPSLQYGAPAAQAPAPSGGPPQQYGVPAGYGNSRQPQQYGVPASYQPAQPRAQYGVPVQRQQYGVPPSYASRQGGSSAGNCESRPAITLLIDDGADTTRFFAASSWEA